MSQDLFPLVLLLLGLPSFGCDSSHSPTEPVPSPTPMPTATPAPSPTPTPRCAQLAGFYERSYATSTCIGQRVASGPAVQQVAECTFETYDTVVGGRVTLEATGTTGTVTIVWPSCQGKATGTFIYENLSVRATFSGVVNGTDGSCCGSTNGSLNWIYRR